MTTAGEYPLLHDDIKSLKQFCLRVGKQPYIGDGTKNTFKPEWTDRKNWLTFTQASEAVKRGAKVYHAGAMVPVTGIGLLVGRTGEGLQTLGGDLDTCRDPENGLISPWAIDFISAVKPFYTEISPSGCGLRFFCWGNLPGGRDKVFGNGPQDDLPEDTKKRIIEAKPKVAEKIAKGEAAWNGLEFYEAGRHLSITGWRLDELCFPKEDQTAAIYTALEPYVVAEVVTRIGNEKQRVSSARLPELNILDVINTSGFSDEGGQFVGPHPEMGSVTGRNLVVNPSKNIYCWMHDGINAGGDPWIWLACECGAVSWAAAGSGSLRDARAMKETIAYAIKRGLVTKEQMGEREKSGIKPANTEAKNGYVGLGDDGTLKVTVLDQGVRRLDWFSDCPVCIAVETDAKHKTEYTFKGTGAKDGRKVCFVALASDMSEHSKFRAAMVNAFGAPNLLGKLTYEIVQKITMNTVKKRRIEIPEWDGHIPLVPGMNLADDVEFRLSQKTPVNVYNGDLNAAKHVLRDLLGMHRYAPIIVATVLGAPAFARWHVDDRFGLALWGTTGTLKTTTVQAIMAEFGTGYFDDACVLKHGKVGGTAVGTMEVFILAGIMAQLLDNVKTVDPKDTQQYIAIIHGVIEGGEKARGKKTGGLKDGSTYKCTPIITGEVKPEEASTSARVLNLDWSRPDESKLTSVQANVDVLPVIGYQWLKYLSETRLDLIEGFAGARSRYMAKFTAERFTNPGRLATIYVMLRSVWRLLCDSPMGDVFAEFTDEFVAAIDEAIIAQGKAVTDETEVERFLTGIRELISSTPSCLEGDGDSGDKRYLGKVIGKKIGDTIFLLPKITLSELERLKIFSQAPSVASLSKELNDRGLLKLNHLPHLQARHNVGGRQVSGWWLTGEWTGLVHSKKDGVLGKIDPLPPVSTQSTVSTPKIYPSYKSGQSVMNIEDTQGNENNRVLSVLSGLGNNENREIDSCIKDSIYQYTPSTLSTVASPDSDNNNKAGKIKKKQQQAARMTMDFGGYKKDQVITGTVEELHLLPCVPIKKQDVCHICKKAITVSDRTGRGDLCKECFKAMCPVSGGELSTIRQARICTGCGKKIDAGMLQSSEGLCEVCYWKVAAIERQDGESMAGDASV